MGEASARAVSSLLAFGQEGDASRGIESGGGDWALVAEAAKVADLFGGWLGHGWEKGNAQRLVAQRGGRLIDKSGCWGVLPPCEEYRTGFRVFKVCATTLRVDDCKVTKYPLNLFSLGLDFAPNHRSLKLFSLPYVTRLASFSDPPAEFLDSPEGATAQANGQRALA